MSKLELYLILAGICITSAGFITAMSNIKAGLAAGCAMLFLLLVVRLGAFGDR